jgi:hypothetical protein
MSFLVLFSILVVCGLPVVHAWNFFVSPASRTVVPGGTTSFSLSVVDPVPGNPIVQLLVSPPVLGISASFSVNNQHSPYTSTMTVTVDPSKAPGTYVLSVWAWDKSQLFPGPGNIARNVQIIVGSAFDYSLMLVPSSVTVKQGETANYQVSIIYNNPAYSGTSISVQLSGLGPGMNYQLIPSPPSLGISTSPSTPVGTYTIVLTGSAMGVIHQTSALLVVQPAEQPFDFSLSASPTQQSIIPGSSTTYTIMVGLLSGASQNVALSVSGTLTSGISASLNPTSGLASYNSILSISTTSSAAPGQYSLTVTGTAGAKTHTVPITLTVSQSPDFRVEVSPPSQTVVQGQTGSFSVHVAGLNGFNSQVSLSVGGLPSGVSGVFSVPSSSPDYSSTLTITVPGNAPTGSFTLTITGSGGGISRVANAILVVNQAQTTVQITPTATVQTSTTTSGGSSDLLQQNGLLIIAALVVLVVLLAVLAMRGRGGQAASRPAAPPSSKFCGKCGSENPIGNEFCASCGQRLR